MIAGGGGGSFETKQQKYCGPLPIYFLCYSVVALKGLPRAMDLAFDVHAWSVQGLSRGRSQFSNFLGAPMIL
jgi:hypothetical protein